MPRPRRLPRMSAVTSLSRNDPTVDPGGQAAITIKIRNAGSIVDRFDVDVVGPTAGWVRVDPPPCRCSRASRAPSPSRSRRRARARPRAGVYPFGIRVRPAADPSGSTVEEGTDLGHAVHDASRPTSSPRRRAARASAGTRSSSSTGATRRPTSPSRPRTRTGGSSSTVQPPRSVVAPDARVEFGVRVEVDDPFPFGADRQRPFQVRVEPGRQAPIALRGTLLQRPMLPGWIPPVAGVVGVVALLGVGAFLAKAGPFARGAIADARSPRSPPRRRPRRPPPHGAAVAEPSAQRRPRGPEPRPRRRRRRPSVAPERDPVRGLRARGPRPARRSLARGDRGSR